MSIELHPLYLKAIAERDNYRNSSIVANAAADRYLAERNEARAALREAIKFRDRNLIDYDLDAWIKAAGLEDA